MTFELMRITYIKNKLQHTHTRSTTTTNTTQPTHKHKQPQSQKRKHKHSLHSEIAQDFKNDLRFQSTAILVHTQDMPLNNSQHSTLNTRPLGSPRGHRGLPCESLRGHQPLCHPRQESTRYIPFNSPYLPPAHRRLALIHNSHR